MKKLLITEKPSVAMEFAKVLKLGNNRKNGYIENENWVITWCVGHLVTMSYPEKYDEKLKFWRLDTLPFIPEEFKYEVIPQVQKQFETNKTHSKVDNNCYFVIEFASNKNIIPGSSSGRTGDSGSSNGGSNPSPGVFYCA